MAKSRDRRKADSAVRKIGDDLPGRIEEAVTGRWKASRIAGFVISSRGLRAMQSRRPPAQSEEERPERPIRRRTGGGDRDVRGSALRAVAGKRTPRRTASETADESAKPAEADCRCVKHRVLRSRSGARVPMTSAEAHEVRVLVVE